LKKKYPKAQFRVWIHKYSMGEAIYVKTDLIQNRGIDATSETALTIRRLLREYESVDHDEWGDILSGGNTFLFIEKL